MVEESEDERRARMEKLAGHKRYNMKSLGRLVDSNRLTGVARPASEPAAPTLPRRTARTEDPDEEVTEPAAPTVAPRPEDAPDPVASITTADPVVGGPVVRFGPGGGHGDGVDRSEIGDTVTRTGLSDRIDAGAGDDTTSEDDTLPRSLARRMLDGEIAPGGRISDPRDVSGIVLDLAKDVPASVAVSVVRIDEEVEVVGDTIDPTIDPAMFSSVFSGVFRSVRPAAQVLEHGPLGAIQDVVIEGERMDLVLRPLGDRYYLMLLEDRRDPEADLALARMRMATIAPGLTAILAQQDGEA